MLPPPSSVLGAALQERRGREGVRQRGTETLGGLEPAQTQQLAPSLPTQLGVTRPVAPCDAWMVMEKSKGKPAPGSRPRCSRRVCTAPSPGALALARGPSHQGLGQCLGAAWTWAGAGSVSGAKRHREGAGAERGGLRVRRVVPTLPGGLGPAAGAGTGAEQCRVPACSGFSGRKKIKGY